MLPQRHLAGKGTEVIEGTALTRVKEGPPEGSAGFEVFSIASPRTRLSQSVREDDEWDSLARRLDSATLGELQRICGAMDVGSNLDFVPSKAQILLEYAAVRGWDDSEPSEVDSSSSGWTYRGSMELAVDAQPEPDA